MTDIRDSLWNRGEQKTIIVVIGRRAVTALDEGVITDLEDAEKMGARVEIHDFGTTGEMNAYIIGVSDALGYRRGALPGSDLEDMMVFSADGMLRLSTLFCSIHEDLTRQDGN